MLSLLTIYWAVYTYAGPMYAEWAQGQQDKIKGILNAARDDHTNAVKARIDSVKDLSGVIDVTKNLFAVSKARFHAHSQLEFMSDLSVGDCSARGSGIRASAEDKHRR